MGMQNSSPQHEFTSEQKTGFVLLLVFGVLTVVLGFLQLRNTIYKPFVIKAKADGSEKLNALLDDTTRLQSIDTDQDGLSDYEELNFIQTSPYIPDTDSDGITDKQEIDNGTDPLCPEGDSCEARDLPVEEDVEQVGASELLDKAPSFADIAGTPEVNIAEIDGAPIPGGGDLGDVQELIDNPAKLREIILETGQIEEADLAQFSDDQLKEAFSGMLKQSDTTQ